MPAFVVPAIFGGSVAAFIARIVGVAIIWGLLKFMAKIGLVYVAYDWSTDTIESIFNPETYLTRAYMGRIGDAGRFAYDVLLKTGFLDGILILWSAVVAGIGWLAANKAWDWAFGQSAHQPGV